MKNKIAIIIPHKGVGDILFHYKFINSVHHHHKSKLIIIANPSSKADLIFKNNNKIKKVILLNLRRPSIINYISRIITLVKILYKFNFNTIYYTGFNKWHRLSFFFVKVFKKLSIKYYKNNKLYILSFLDFFLKKEKIKIIQDLNYEAISNVSKKFLNKAKLYKKPWVFLSIDTSEDQIKIPAEILNNIIDELQINYKTVFVNTSTNNKKKLKYIKKRTYISTTKFNILEISHVIKNSELFIGNESGPAILASIHKKKSVIFISKNIKKESWLMQNFGLRYYFSIEKINKNKDQLFKFFKTI